ncbi:MAG TPA: type II secretion system F family protein [Candidatus Aphodovivens avicola]|nr:type II secretion system F family protein [Candidatus Aphodovivens avicola]
MGIACAAAFAAGVLGMGLAGSWRAAARRRAARARALDEALPLEGAGGLERGVIRLAMRLGHPGRGAPPRAPARTPRRGRKESSSADLVKRAGLEGRVDEDGLRAARLRLAGMGAAAGAVVGAVISLEMGLLLAAVAAAAGLYAPTWALRRLERERALELERSLPEMLEVVALGLRSGLSFDRSFQLYSMHFPSSFARSCASAQKSWSLGLRTRDEALRELAQSYRSDQLERTAERIVRSLRFGSALAPDLEAAAAEARARRRSQVEERVAKAPVKMMVPTGALILPAMLILILGPILLELMQG